MYTGREGRIGYLKLFVATCENPYIQIGYEALPNCVRSVPLSISISHKWVFVLLVTII